ncbi:pitrilysin family protein [Flavobacterium sp. YO12]|uniref:M16 family metallopeptidase n=1 Tax=Flavobacterium sp. YO12 TaxID=1920029 RepID=UPI00100B3A50|nr:pitrilysin family protein [Flavobacterium sp. YO12]RXM48392.1 peptidase M16 [Flavobacterium sp. YO12]
MKKNFLYHSAFILLAAAALNAQSNPADFKKVQELGGIEEYQYQPNGMNILLIQDNSAPVVTVQIVYRVGSKHEVTGNTGSTHLLEHLNFKGTPTFNKRKGTAIFSVLQNIGANMNATTWYDRTNYYETIPSDQIEVAMHIEADRMRNSLLLKEDKDSEMTVVRNEFERAENNPNTALATEIMAAAYMAYPYHHATIGWRADIENMPMEALKKFYDTYYWPDNATLTIIGDFQKENVFKLVDKYFGKITKAPHSMPEPYTTEPVQYGPRRVVMKKPGQQSVVLVAYKTPGRMHADSPALAVLSEIIGSGTSSHINKTFVDTGIAMYGYAQASNFKEVNLLTIGLGLTPDKKQEEISSQLAAMIERIKKDGVTQAEVDRVIAKLNATTILSRDGSAAIADELNEAIAGGDWKDYITGSERLSKVTVADVNRVAKQYLVEDQSTTGYFIPVQKGEQTKTMAQANKVNENDSKVFFRNPELAETETAIPSTVQAMEQIQSNYETIVSSVKGENYVRKSVAGIDVVSVKTGAKDLVTVSASFPIADYFNKGGNSLVPGFVTQLLEAGTTKNNKFQFAEKLEKIGLSINVGADKYNININFKCLKKDLNQAIALLSEELRYPLFDEKEFQLVKKQFASSLKQRLDNPKTQGGQTLMQALYTKGNPNYSLDTDASLKELEAITLNDLKAFHNTYFGTKGMHLVAAGDVDTKTLYTSLNNNFKGFMSGEVAGIKSVEPTKVNGQTKVVFIPQKSSAEMFIGQYTGIKRKDKDFLPFYIATGILGGDFSGRLMMTVRDNDGLTYNISSAHSGHDYAGGYWYVNASFNPQLFQKGLDATMVQINKWAKDGVTAEELTAKKANLIGSFKVGLATTSGLSGTILKNLERGNNPEYLEQYVKDIEAVTLDQVNQSIKKYVDLDKLVIIKAGTLEEK